MHTHHTKHAGIVAALTVMAGIVAACSTTSQPPSAESVPPTENTATLEEGKKIAFDRKKGNCLACHMMGDGVSPGNIAPPLLAMKSRYPDRAKLHAQIWDATARNPLTSMPPFGKHRILTEEEVDKVVDYVWSL